MGFLDHSLDRNIPVPLYYQLKQTILSEIQSGKAKPDDLLPTEEQYQNCYQISRATVRQAINELAMEGWVYRVKAKGTFVSRKQERVETNLESMYSSWVRKSEISNKRAEMVVESITLVKAKQDEAAALDIATGTRVIRIYRLQRVNEEIISFIRSYLRYPLCEQAMDAEKFKKMSMYNILKERKTSEIGHIKRSIYAKTVDRSIAKKIGLREEDPVLVVINEGSSKKNGAPVIYEEVYYSGFRNKLILEYDVENTNF